MTSYTTKDHEINRLLVKLGRLGIKKMKIETEMEKINLELNKLEEDE